MNQLDRLVQGVKETSDLREASVKFCGNLAAELATTIGNDSAGAALHQTLVTHGAFLADTLLASTPMIVATHPIPEPAGDDLVVERLPGESDEDYQKRIDAAPEIKKLPGDPA